MHILFAPGVRALAGATFGGIVRRPLYAILLLSFAAAVFFSRLLTLFSFYQEMNMVREMGMATLAFWAFLVVLITSGLVVTQELEDRTAVTLLAKPLSRSGFLLGTFLGISASLVPGLFILGGVLFITLGMMASPHLPLNDRVVAEGLARGDGPFATAWRISWEGFVRPQGGVVLGGTVLALLEGVILAALAVSFSAFSPTVVAVSATTLLFILGNISGYMVAGVERLGIPALTLPMRLFACALPNLGYFNLQTIFSEGRIVSLKYLALASVYSALYVSTVFLISCSLFRKREVR